LAGELAQRALRLPRLIGWIAAGMLLGPAIGRALGPQDLAELRPLLEIAAGVVLFQLGQRVDPAWLGRNPWILATSIVEAAAAFGAVFCVLLALDARPLTAALAAAVGMATAPAVTLTVARETRAQGQVAERMLLLTALNCIYAFVTVNVLLGWAASDHSADWRASALHPLYVIFGSAALAGGFALSTLALLRLLGRKEETQFLCVLALVMAAVWAAGTLKLSLVLTLLGYGTLMRLLDRRRLFVSLTFGRIGTILLMLLFALTAAAIDLALLPAGLAAGAAVAAARFAGKALGVFAFARPSGLPLRKAWLLALSLTPMSAIALVLVHETAGRLPALDTSLAAVLIGSVLILEVAGPLLAKFALVRAGETDERLD
jgi:Kef-type K+ transport system membrane component KefB